VIVYYTVQILGSVTPSQLVSIIKPLNDSELTTTGNVFIVNYFFNFLHNVMR